MSRKWVSALIVFGLLLLSQNPASAQNIGGEFRVQTQAGILTAGDPVAPQVPSAMTDAYTWPGWARPYIDQAVTWQVVQGLPSSASTVGTTVYLGQTAFAPFEDVTQAQFAVMLARAAGNAVPDPTQSVSAPLNVTDQNLWYYPALQALSSDGILASWEFPGSFSPATSMTRGQAATVTGLALEYYGAGCGGGGPVFADLPATYPGYAAIRQAVACGVVRGYGGGVFAPGDLLTRAQAATILVRFIEALPGAKQLGYQRSEMTAYLQGTGTQAFSWPGVSNPLLQADNLDLPAAGVPVTPAGLAAAPYATWSDIHLWLATGNWIALAEGKYTAMEAAYISDCGLEPWQAGMVDSVLVAYAGDFGGRSTAFPLLADLGDGSASYAAEAAATGGDLNPVTRVAVAYPAQPFTGDGWHLTGAWLVTNASGRTTQIEPTLYRKGYQGFGVYWWAWRAQGITAENR